MIKNVLRIDCCDQFSAQLWAREEVPGIVGNLSSEQGNRRKFCFMSQGCDWQVFGRRKC